MRLSIVIVSFNARGDLERCLDSLASSPPTIEHDVAVVDNASSDGSAEAARRRGVRVFALDRNVGFAAANNVGIRATSGELVLLLNSDTIVPAGGVDGLVERLLAHPDAAAAGPRLVDGDGGVELSWGPMLSPFNEARQKLTLLLHRSGFGPVRRAIERLSRSERNVDWVSGACLLVRRRDAEAVGLLDERFFLYTEDVDFCASLRARGRRILFTGAVEVRHLRGRSRRWSPAAGDAAYRRSQLAFYEKHHPRWAPLLRAYLRLKGQAW